MNINTLYKVLVPRNLTWSSTLKSRYKLAPLLLRVVALTWGNMTVQKVKSLYHFASKVCDMHRAMGDMGLAKYLKVCHLALVQFAADKVLESPFSQGSNIARTRSGIPRLIPRESRVLIARGDIRVFRLWLSLFGLYRCIDFKGKLSLKTIMEHTVLLPSETIGFETWVKTVPESNLLFATEILPNKLIAWSLPPILSSSPNSRGLSSVLGLFVDLFALAIDLRVRKAITEWLRLTKNIELLVGLKGLFAIIDRIGIEKIKTMWRNPPCGKLAFLEEPGKVRVVALVDLVTQGLLKPLHDRLFEILRTIPQDGTFNQAKPLERLVQNNYPYLASYDLSAATDRLPVDLQVTLLARLIGPELANTWRELLVDRAYRLPRIARSHNFGVEQVWYATGQPMGALSSWAMLAMTHHAIVQYCAHKCGCVREGEWFQDYALLGDDIVLANEAVAQEYYSQMRIWGVDINLTKSMVSRLGSFEFAKRIFWHGHDVSPVSLKEVSVALCNVSSLIELFKRNAKYAPVKLAHVARFCGFGYKNLARLPIVFSLNNRLSRLSSLICRPGGLIDTPFEVWISAVGPGYGAAQYPWKVWAGARAFWETVVSKMIRMHTKVDEVLFALHTWKLSTAKNEEDHFVIPSFQRTAALVNQPALPLPEEEPFGDREVIDQSQGLSFREGEILEFDGFWREWIIRPFEERIRRNFEKVDDEIRVVDPTILPEFQSLEDLFIRTFAVDEELSSLPKRLNFHREEIPSGVMSRLVKIWLKVRKIVLRGGSEPLGFTTVLSEWPQARRRAKAG